MNSAIHVAAAAMSSNQLPNELIVDIISRLAAKDLLRFKYVSKSWYACINDPYFVKKHLKSVTDTESSANISLYNGCVLYRVDFGTDDVVSRYTSVKLDDVQIPYNHCLVGSCNGLVCLSDDDRFFIWNPSTGNSHESQHLPITFRGLPLPEGSYSIIRGFGHDRFSDDYKVVEILHFYGDDCTLLDTEARVYSLKANSWDRKSLDFPSHRDHSHSGTFINTSNALHWVIRKREAETINENYLIAAFGLGVDNEYHEVQQPDDNFKFNDISNSLGVLRGCLCIRSISSSSIDIWIMKEYGVKESWTCLISIAQPCPSRPWSCTVIPLAYSRCGDKVLLKEDPFRRLIWYNLKTKKITMAKLDGLKDLCVGFVCLQSIVPVNGDIELKKPATASIEALDRQEKEDAYLKF